MLRAVLIDLSGTLHIEKSAIPGAQAALQKLRDAGFLVKFVTNTTKESVRMLHANLNSLGFNIASEELFTSLSAARRLVESRGLRPMYLLTESAFEDFEGIPTNDPNAVVVGLAPEQFNYERLSEAMNLLLKEGSALISIHKGRYFKSKAGLSLGPGAFVVGLEYSTGVKSDVVGKPEKAFFESALRSLGVSASEAVMVGDDVRDDIGGALAAGLRAGLLVRTGKYLPGDEANKGVAPTATVDDFPAAVEWILRHRAD